MLIVGAVGGEARAKCLQIIERLDIIDYLVAGGHFAQNFLGDTLFIQWGQNGLRYLAQIRQPIGKDGGNAQQPQ